MRYENKENKIIYTYKDRFKNKYKDNSQVGEQDQGIRTFLAI